MKQKTPPADENKVDALNVLFPEEVVKLNESGTEVVTVRPLSLEQLPHVTDAFSKLMKMAELGGGPAEIASMGMRELLVLLPHCLDRPASEVPGGVVPDLVEIVIRQNISEAVITKWTALVEKVTDLGGKAGAAVNQKPSPSS